MMYDITNRFSHLNKVSIDFAKDRGGDNSSLLIYFFDFF
jgi:hypothetical protein